MTIGFAMLVHTAFDRAAEVARYWAERDCPVAIHVDRRVPDDAVEAFRRGLSDLPNLQFTDRRRCNWGTWSLVEASKEAAQLLLDRFPAVSHVYLASGSCLPLRPVQELKAYLADHPDTDFIESVTIDDVPWIQGGLDVERFTLYFPFGWKSQRFLFDQFVTLQRRLGVSRPLPGGLVPHMGSQWWCLTRQTLTDILQSPRRAEMERYFKRVWIPDESYFQTVTRLHARRIESRSLTLSKFDFQGKPHVFFDDHLQLLRRSDCFVARKIWPRADLLYRTFLSDDVMIEGRREPRTGRVDRVFSKAVQRRIRGRAGLRMPGRFPNPHHASDRTAAPYSVFCGLDDLFADFPRWLETTTGICAHGALFATDRVEFEGGARTFAGALCDSAALRDYDPAAFLRNLIWNTRGERQGFQFSPRDRQDVVPHLADDANASITLVTGAWAVPLFRQSGDAGQIRRTAAALQKTERAFADRLRHPGTRAHVRIMTLSEFLQRPADVLQTLVEEIVGGERTHLTEIPVMHDLTGFPEFLQGLKNQGMNPYIVGDFHSAFDKVLAPQSASKPYLVQ